MWDLLDMDNVTFSTGTAPDNTADRRRFEQELKGTDMWDGTNLVGGFGDDNAILDDQEDEVLAEALRNAGKQVFSAVIVFKAY